MDPLSDPAHRHPTWQNLDIAIQFNSQPALLTAVEQLAECPRNHRFAVHGRYRTLITSQAPIDETSASESCGCLVELLPRIDTQGITDLRKTTAHALCPECGVASTDLPLHRRTFHSRYPCEYTGCRFTATTAHDLRTHTVAIHEPWPADPTPHVCPDCGDSFPSHADLSAHIVADHMRPAPTPTPDPPRANVTCMICGAVRKRGKAMERHVRDSHPRHRAQICTSCGLSFATSGELSGHMVHSHPELTTPPPPYPGRSKHTMPSATCRKCGETFRTRTFRDRHERTDHTPPVPPPPF